MQRLHQIRETHKSHTVWSVSWQVLHAHVLAGAWTVLPTLAFTAGVSVASSSSLQGPARKDRVLLVPYCEPSVSGSGRLHPQG